MREQILQKELVNRTTKQVIVTKEVSDISNLIETPYFSQVTPRYYEGSDEKPVLGTYTLKGLAELVNNAPKKKKKENEIALLKGIYEGGTKGAYCATRAPFIFFDVDVKKKENAHLFDAKLNSDVFEALQRVAVLAWRSNSGFGMAGILYVPQIVQFSAIESKDHLLVGKAIGDSLKKKIGIESFDEAQFRFRQLRYIAHQDVKRQLNLKPMAFRYEIKEVLKTTALGRPIYEFKNNEAYPGSIEEQFNQNNNIEDILIKCGFTKVGDLRYKHPTTTSANSGVVNQTQNKFYNFSSSFSRFSHFTPYFLCMFYMYDMDQRAFLKDLRSQGYENKAPKADKFAEAAKVLGEFNGPREEAIFRACYILKYADYHEKFSFVDKHSHNEMEDELFYHYLNINKINISYDCDIEIDHFVYEKVSQVFEYLDKHKRVAMVADTGVGKTTAILKGFEALKPSKRMLFLAPLTVIVDQIERKYPNIVCLTGSSIPEDHTKAKSANIVVATYEQGTKHLKEGNFDYVVIDEVHELILANSYKADEISALTSKIKDRKVLGLTGTPSQLLSKLGFKLIKVNQRVPSKLNVIKRIDNRDGLKVILQHQEGVKGKAIYRLNSKKNIGDVQKKLVEMGKLKSEEIMILESGRQSKSKSEFKTLAYTSQFPDHVKVVLTTAIIDEGVSIDQSGFTDVVFIETEYNPTPEAVKQFFARFRNQDPQRKYYYYMRSSLSHEPKNFQINYEYQLKLERLENDIKDRMIEQLSNKDMANNDHLFYQDSTINEYYLSKDINEQYFKSMSTDEYLHFLESNYSLEIEADINYYYKKVDDSDIRKRNLEAKKIVTHYWLNNRYDVINALLEFTDDPYIKENTEYVGDIPSDDVSDVVIKFKSMFEDLQRKYIQLEKLGTPDIDSLIIDKDKGVPFGTQRFNRNKVLRANLKTIHHPLTKTDRINKAKIESFLAEVRELDAFQVKDLETIWKKQKTEGGRYNSYNLLDLVLHFQGFKYNSKESRYIREG